MCRCRALRLPPERNDDPGCRPARNDEESDRGPDPQGDERTLSRCGTYPRIPTAIHGSRRCDGKVLQVSDDEARFCIEKEFSRKAFLKGGRSPIVGLSMLGGGLSGQSERGECGERCTGCDAGRYPASAVNADGSVTMSPAEDGLWSGHLTGSGRSSPRSSMSPSRAVSSPRSLFGIPLLRIRLRITPASTTVGCQRTANGGPPLRQAAAQARQALLGLASAQLGVPVAGLSVSGGVVSGGGKTVTYGQLVGGKLFNTTIAGMDGTAVQIANGLVAPVGR